MKTVYHKFFIFLSLLITFGSLNAQKTSEAERLYYFMGINDRLNGAASARHIDEVNYTDIYDRSLLMHASVGGFNRICRILLRKGADPDLQAIDGVTAPMYAAYNGRTRIMKKLLDRGFNLGLQSIDGFTALM
ncbi:MAG: ankyrin repeat domain-containing protein, partial [Bacteroidales bacterium]|nr:ankyrin repeat domain-containing protein [Bacteroidales bacterium]